MTKLYLRPKYQKKRKRKRKTYIESFKNAEIFQHSNGIYIATGLFHSLVPSWAPPGKLISNPTGNLSPGLAIIHITSNTSKLLKNGHIF